MRKFERRAKVELGISMVQLAALFYLAENDGCLHKHLAEALGIQPAGVSGLVDRLQRGGRGSGCGDGSRRNPCSQHISKWIQRVDHQSTSCRRLAGPLTSLINSTRAVLPGHG